MRERLLRCPGCQAPLTPPSRFASSMTCGYCGGHVELVEGGVDSARFQEALEQWNAPPTGVAKVSFAGTHWLLGPRLARGESAEVHYAARARRPTQFAVLHVAQDEAGDAALQRTLRTLTSLGGSKALGGMLTGRVPLHLYEGLLLEGPQAGRLAAAFVWRPGFRYTLRDVRERLGRTLNAHQAIWAFRRICETLTAMYRTGWVQHRTGWVHGAIRPEHVLIEDGEHGVALVGFGSSGAEGERLPLTRHDSADFPTSASLSGDGLLSRRLDIGLAARTIIYGLGGDPVDLSVPPGVPTALASFFTETAQSPGEDAWQYRERAGALGDKLLGARSFAPLVTSHDTR